MIEDMRKYGGRDTRREVTDDVNVVRREENTYSRRWKNFWCKKMYRKGGGR